MGPAGPFKDLDYRTVVSIAWSRNKESRSLGKAWCTIECTDLMHPNFEKIKKVSKGGLEPPRPYGH